MTIDALTTIPYRSLSLASAETLLDAGQRLAAERGLAAVMAVVGPSGHLIAFRRMDGGRLNAVDVAIGKAKSAAQMGKPSSVFAKAIDGGETSVLSVPGLLPLRGGLPIVVDGEVVGAIGVSGISASGDEELAEAILSAI